MVCPYNYEPFCAEPVNGGKAATYGNKCAIEVQECRDNQSNFNKFLQTRECLLIFNLFLPEYKVVNEGECAEIK